MEYFLSRHFRGAQEASDSLVMNKALEDTVATLGSPLFQSIGKGGARSNSDISSSSSSSSSGSTPGKGTTTAPPHERNTDLPQMSTPTCSPCPSSIKSSVTSPPSSTDIASAVLPPSPLSSTNQPSDDEEAGRRTGRRGGGGGEAGGGGGAGMEISFSPSPAALGEEGGGDLMAKTEEAESASRGVVARGSAGETEEAEESLSVGDPHKTGKKTKDKEKKKAEDGDILLHPLLLLRIANCEWRVLREFAPDIAETFKSHVRHFKLKRNPYVHTLQQQIDYKLGKHGAGKQLSFSPLVTMSVRKPRWLRWSVCPRRASCLSADPTSVFLLASVSVSSLSWSPSR